MFLDDLEKAALMKCGLNREKPIVVGVSGGADSLALMHGLHLLGFSLLVAHLDHAIRPESRTEAVYVASLAESLGLPFVKARMDVKSIAEKKNESLEEAARNLRYRFLFDQARQHGAQAVAVAHHADDQVETVLMHFLRGAALPGLSGMPCRQVIPLWDENIPLVRPLLDLWRGDIEAYIAETDMTPCIDLSNQDITYFRNRLRHELIPTLEAYNPQFRQTIWRMANVFREEDRYLDDLGETAWKTCLDATSEGLVSFHRPEFIALPKAMQRRILRRAVSMLRPDLRDVGFDAVERGLAFVEHSSVSGEVDLAARLRLVIVEDVLVVKDWDSALPDWENPLLTEDSFQQMLEPDEHVDLRHGWRIRAELLSSVPDDLVGSAVQLEATEAWLDLDCLQMPLTVRGRSVGDRWCPLGMGGHSQKLSDFLINQKIPTHLRDLWPLVCSEEDIVWIAGLRPSDTYKVTSDTKVILRLYLDQA